MSDKRLAVPALGEYFTDLLALDAWLCNRSKASQSQDALLTYLKEREADINARLQYLAQKRGITVDELRQLILEGKAQQD